MAPVRRRKTIVLVVEDDANLRQLYRSVLTLAGYIVISVEDGVDALRYVEAESPGLVVLDLGLPRLNGRDVQRELAAHSETQNIPIIVVSGDPGDINPADFACVLRKPFDPQDLLEAVQRCLRRHSRKRKPPK
jgi:DNA-binding response OmpR family regulator